MKVLFLDVDGVLNSSTTLQIDKDLCPTKLALLKQIVDHTNCKIVLSSTWRLYEGHRNRLRNSFLSWGIPLWIGETPDLGFKFERRDEIEQWVNNNEVESCVILDDDPFARPLLPLRVKCGVIKTTMKDGLTESQANQIVSFFNTKPA